VILELKPLLFYHKVLVLVGRFPGEHWLVSCPLDNKGVEVSFFTHPTNSVTALKALYLTAQ